MKTALIAIHDTSQDDGWVSASGCDMNLRDTMKTMVQTEDADEIAPNSISMLLAS